MDPNTVLYHALNEARNIVKQLDREGGEVCILDEANALADAVIALDAWLSKGGFLPERWTAT